MLIKPEISKRTNDQNCPDSRCWSTAYNIVSPNPLPSYDTKVHIMNDSYLSIHLFIYLQQIFEKLNSHIKINEKKNKEQKKSNVSEKKKKK